MTAVAKLIQRGAFVTILPSIPEADPTVLKLSYIPLIGTISSGFQEVSLAKRFTQTADAPRAIEVIKVKNRYKVASAVRNLVTAALLVAGMALGILGEAFAFGAILAIGLAGIHIYRINKNIKVIKELQSTGLIRPGMRIA